MSAPPNLVLAVGPQSTQVIVTFSLTTAMGPGTLVQGQIQAFGPLVPPSSIVTVPATEVWHIIDIYIVGGPVAADALLLTTINGYPQNFAPQLSTLNLNLLTRYTLPMSIPLAPNTTWAASLSLIATPTANATQYVTYQITRAPFTG